MALFGELLGKMVRITPHDVEEILQEQAASHRRFGEIALIWGLCQPQHIWNAWMTQLDEHAQWITLDDFGIDCQALTYLPRQLATDLCAVPVRAWGNQVVLAIADTDPAATKAALPAELRPRAHFVFAQPEEIRKAIDEAYRELALTA